MKATGEKMSPCRTPREMLKVLEVLLPMRTHPDAALNAIGTRGRAERHVQKFCNVVTLSPSPIVINHDALLFCCAMGLYHDDTIP